ncbi:hypothetical protein FHT12_002888 [Xanthomonas campestris]|nr:hypothetical protein [Xanthomonas euroxanthea]
MQKIHRVHHSVFAINRRADNTGSWRFTLQRDRYPDAAIAGSVCAHPQRPATLPNHRTTAAHAMSRPAAAS